ncbi:recombinase family protein [Pseudomonas petrae]|uniref:Recombinase family protein n=1 Tax=Pseudomonas petrae TaxID=2912190 RepID=A0ABS9IF13_9PSED|nr:recombinase family protein [Pseudomonas petrae]MCF7537083.1 recombinase family protein [Pseudomonas petrae]MCF7545673.1 recombinase family protein [Pseudomonas petrae]
MTVQIHSYKRISSRTQKEGTGIDRQEALIQEYLAHHKRELAREFIDLGISGFRGKNARTGALREFLDLIAAGVIKANDVLLVENFDRLTRMNGIDATKLVVDILSAKIIIVTLSDNQIYDYRQEDHSSILFKINFVLSRANEESRIKRNRSLGAWARKHSEAKSSNKVMTKRLPYWISYNEETETLNLNSHRADEVKRIFDLLEIYGCARTANEINKTSTDKKWTLIAIRHLSRAKSVYGCLEIYKTKSENGESVDYEELEDYYPAVISKERFYNLQTKLNIRTETHDKVGRESKGFRNIFKGVIFCEHCDTALHQNFTKRKCKEYMYLICAKSLVGACPAGRKIFIPYGYIVEPFLLYYKNYELEKIIRKSGDVQSLVENRNAYNAEIEDKQSTIEKIAQSIELNGGDIPKILLNRIRKIETEISQLTNKRDLADVEIAKMNIYVEVEQAISRADIDELLENEEGRIRFNMLLKESQVQIRVLKRFEDSEPFLGQDFQDEHKMSVVVINNKAKGFGLSYYFDRKHARLAGGTYYFYTKKFVCGWNTDFTLPLGSRADFLVYDDKSV